MSWRNNEAAQRFAERRRREDEAPRLMALVPRISSLQLQVEERRSGSSTGEAPHLRHIVVAHAPALFMLPCRDSACKEGGHDLTDAVMRSLRAGETRFEGEDTCMGQIGSAPCPRVLRFVGIATYEPQPEGKPGR